MWIESVSICLVTTVATLLSEGLSWYFFYRKPAYKELKEKIESSFKTIQKMKREGRDLKTRTRLEKQMQRDNATLTGMRMYSMVFLSIAMLALYQVLKHWYADIVVAKLPFVPLQFLTKMTHAGLTSLDLTDCSFACIYGLSTLAIRANIQKVIGGTPKGVGSPFDQLANMGETKED